MAHARGRTCAACGRSEPHARFRADRPGLTKCKACAYRLDAAARRSKALVHPGAGTKHCPGCRKLLPAGAFGRNRAKLDGLQPACRACTAAYARRRRGEPRPGAATTADSSTD